MLAPGVFEIICPTTRPSNPVLRVPLDRHDRAGYVCLHQPSLHLAIFGLSFEYFVAAAAAPPPPLPASV
jgi:hypothetical protein